LQLLRNDARLKIWKNRFSAGFLMMITSGYLKVCMRTGRAVCTDHECAVAVFVVIVQVSPPVLSLTKKVTTQ